MTLEALTMTRYPTDFHFYQSETTNKVQPEDLSYLGPPLTESYSLNIDNSKATVWKASYEFAGIGSKIISHTAVIKNEGESEDYMSGCAVRWNNNEKIYEPKGKAPLVVWSEEKCLEHFKKGIKEGKSLERIMMLSAAWLADAPQGWETAYRSDCVKVFHMTLDKYREVLEELPPEPVKKVKLFGGKK